MAAGRVWQSQWATRWRSRSLQSTVHCRPNDAWEKHGAAALEQTAKLYPDRFVGICSHLIPKDVSVSLTAALPGDLEASDWTLVLEVLGAVKRGLPVAGVRPPGEVMSFVLAAIRAHDAKVIEGAE